jgi:hypothetical protein
MCQTPPHCALVRRRPPNIFEAADILDRLKLTLHPTKTLTLHPTKTRSLFVNA